MGVYDDVFDSMRKEIDRLNQPYFALLTFAKWDKQWWAACKTCHACLSSATICLLHFQFRELLDQLRDKALEMDATQPEAFDDENGPCCEEDHRP